MLSKPENKAFCRTQVVNVIVQALSWPERSLKTSTPSSVHAAGVVLSQDVLTKTVP